MRYLPIITSLLLLSIFAGARAQTPDSVDIDLDSLTVAKAPPARPDTLLTVKKSDTAKAVASHGKPDSLAAAAQNQPKKLTLIKRKYNSHQQVFLATCMMIFVVGIMTMAQQWNPR
jgi:hypothetical protein